MFRKKNPLAIGVDVGSSSVKVMEMTENRDRFKVERFAVEPLPRNVVVENAITDIDRVSKAIRAAIKKSGTKRKHVIVAVAAAQAMNKIISVPGGLQGEELDQQVQLEAEHQVPYAISEINLDYEQLGPSVENPTSDEVLLAACRKEIVDERVSALEGAGLVATVVDISSLANERAFGLIAPSLPEGGVEKVVAILDYGTTASHLYVVHRRRLVYYRDYAFGGKTLTESIQRRFGISYLEAENKKRSGNLPENYRTDILDPFLDSMAQEANRAIQLFLSSTQYEHVDNVFITGGCSALPKAADRISEKTQVTARLSNPFANTKLASSVDKKRIYRYAPLLLTVCGLAMRGAVR